MKPLKRRIMSIAASVLVLASLTLPLLFPQLRSLIPGLGAGGTAPGEVVVSKRSLTFSVEATGILRATSVRNFGAPAEFNNYWQFQLVSLIQEGKAVKKGDVLVVFDAQRIRDDLQRYQNDLDQAQKEIEKVQVQIELEQHELATRLATAENQFEKKKLKQEGVTAAIESSSTIELDRLALEQARREVEALRARIAWHKKSSEARTNVLTSRKVRAGLRVSRIQKGMEQFEVKADRDGVAVYKLKWNGERFQIGETVWSSQPVVEIPDLNTLQALALVPEVDLGKVKLGQKAEITIDALPGRAFTGKVVNIGQLVKPKSWDIPNKVLDVEIALDEIDAAVMRPSMSIRAKIETSVTEPVLAIPAKSVRESSGFALVKKRTPEGWKDHPVVLAESNGAYVRIKSGLEAGERIAADYSAVR
jgi:multidrug resistance efflux pump